MATDVNEIEFAEKENRVLHLLKMFGAWCRKRTIGAVGLFMVLVILAAALLNPVIKRYDPNETNVIYSGYSSSSCINGDRRRFRRY